MPHDPPMDPDNPNEFQRKSHASSVFFGLSLLAVVLIALAWPGHRDQSPKFIPKGRAPTIEAAGWLNGEAPTQESLAGKVVVIEVWATWCGPCRKMLPHLVELHERFADRGVVFIGLTTEGANKVATIRSILDQAGARWLNGWGAGKTVEALEAEYLPKSYVIGPNGVIVWTSDDSGDLGDALEKFLKQIDSRS